jgi:7,8-dihydropterin-6-yl-methyl-4-(beta-D-ribofuranosyl)aminobenzene 5'-phosphate synthase
MSSSVKLKLIAEGSTKHERKILRWGLSFLVGDVLFDAFGREDIFQENVKRFKIDLSCVKHVVISHEDWDHVAGLGDFLQTHPKTRVYICRKSGKALKELIRSNAGSFVEVDKPRKISPNIFSLGQMRADTGRGILYEQALVVKSRNGFSVVTGCAHPGIVRIARQAVKIFGKKIHAVCGGFHMKDNTQEDNLKIIAELQALGVKKVIPLHCSGPRAFRIFGGFYGKNCIRLKEGNAFEL